jgi:hypothetical protein
MLYYHRNKLKLFYFFNPFAGVCFSLVLVVVTTKIAFFDDFYCFFGFAGQTNTVLLRVLHATVHVSVDFDVNSVTVDHFRRRELHVA